MAGGTRGPVPVPLEMKDQNVTQDVLDLLDSKQPLQTAEDFPAISQAEIKAALDRLASRSMVEYQAIDSEQVLLTKEAEAIVADGSHEYKVWKAVKDAGKVPIKELAVGTRTNNSMEFRLTIGRRTSSVPNQQRWGRAMPSRTSG
jgi:phenylalanyl-tRNA synthetase alpha chain